MKWNFLAGVIKFLLKELPNNNYPARNSRLFCAMVCPYFRQGNEQFRGLILLIESYLG
jgi:hypothetical protein